MHLQRFLDEHPDCLVGRPDLLTPATACVGALAGMAMALALCASSISDGAYHLAVLGLGLAGLLMWPLRSWMPRLVEVYQLIRSGCSSYAISDDQLILVDSAGTAVIIDLTEVTGLELDGTEARLRTESDLQGTIYAVMFDMFDDDHRAPDPGRFFEALAPKLRASCPRATIIHHTVGEGALM